MLNHNFRYRILFPSFSFAFVNVKFSNPQHDEPVSFSLSNFMR